MSYQNNKISGNTMPDFFGRKHIDSQAIDELILRCKASEKGRSRLCIHSNNHELLHCMLICFSPLHTVAPHKNVSTGQIIYIACKGEIQIGLEDDHETCYRLGPNQMKALAVDRSVFRTVKNSIKDYSIFWEITLGPHDRSDTIWKAI